MKKITATILCFLFVFLLSACSNSVNQNATDGTQQQTDKENKNLLFGDIFIESISPYSGAFTEDGSDEEVRNVMSVTLRNEGDISYQLFDFSLAINEEVYSFSTKTLLSACTLTVLEKDRKTMPDSVENFTFQVTDVVSFETEPSVHEDIFEISGSESIINVRNITSVDRENVTVYFKGINENGFFGGITYRVEVGKVSAGELVQVIASKYMPGKTKAVFVTYGG